MQTNPDVKTFLRTVTAAAAVVSGIAPAQAFVMDAKRWDAGTIAMHLNLDSTTLARPLADGSTSWSAVAEQALNEWNATLSSVKFAAVPYSTAAVGKVNSVNNVIWGNTVYGEAWGKGVAGLTITVTQSGSPGRRVESDVIFNSGISFDSYRGALGSSGNTLDFKRVALHEFGHVLGLDHPDGHGQSKSSVMNSYVSDIDRLTQDDVEGAQSAYGDSATPAAIAPSIVSLSGVASAQVGSSATFSVAVSGTAPFAYRWKKNGAAISGANGTTLVLNGLHALDSGVYSVTIANSAGSVSASTGSFSVVAVGNAAGTVSSAAAQPAVNEAPAPGQIVNVSIRTTLEANKTLIVGLTTSGGSSPVLVRAVGPTLAAFGLSGTMPDPTVGLFKNGTQIDSNNNWGGSASLASSFAAVGAFALPSASLDAALLRSIDGGNTVQVSGAVGGTVLVEAYAAGSSTGARLTNISARNRVGEGGDALIAGFTLSGEAKKTVLIRGVGPTLASFGVDGTLGDPKLELYSGVTKISENDTWSSVLSATFQQVGAFALATGSKDAALVATLAPGSYTVRLTGNDGGTGEGLIEIYEIEN